MKNWCKGKTKAEIEDEMRRQIDTYDEHDLREFFFDLMTFKAKKEWVNSWHAED